MAHVRTQIRDALRTRLLGATDAGNNVFVSRVHPIQDTELPAIQIFTKQEEVTARAESSDQQLQTRTAVLSVIVRVKINDGFESAADLIAAQVEAALATDHTLGNLCNYVEYDKSETVLSGDGEAPVAGIAMEFGAHYNVSDSNVEQVA